MWTVTTAGYPDAHFATFPEELIEPCIKAACPPGGTVLDPFAGSGTTAAVARRMGAHAILIELNPEYCEMARKRLAQEVIEFEHVEKVTTGTGPSEMALFPEPDHTIPCAFVGAPTKPP